MTDYQLNKLIIVVEKLLEDIDTIEKALEFSSEAMQTFLEVASEGNIHQHITIDNSLWAYFTFRNSKEEYYKYLDQYLKSNPRKSNTFFGWKSPSIENPNIDATMLLDRVDISLYFIKELLGIELPPELNGENRNRLASIKNGGWKPNALVQRIKAFAQANFDLFCK